MLKLSDLKDKDVINLHNGTRLGYIYDFEVNVEKGFLESIIIPGDNKMISFFSKTSDLIIPWNKIIKIGADAILVNINEE